MTNDSKQNNSPNEQPTAKKFSLENLANLSKMGLPQNLEKIVR